MSNEKTDRDEWTFDGSQEAWEKFDKMVMRRMRKKLAVMAEDFWHGNLQDIGDMTDDEFKEYCDKVLKVVATQDVTRAKWYDSRTRNGGFRTREFQVEWRQRQYELMFDFVESKVPGEADRELSTYDRQHPESVRRKLYKSLGLGSEGDIHDREQHYSACMPEKGKEATPAGSDIRVKPRQMQSERLKFWNICAPQDRATYDYCQERKLVRIIIDHLPEEYEADLSRLLTQVSLRKEITSIRKVHSTKGADGWEWNQEEMEWEWIDESVDAPAVKPDKPSLADDFQDRTFSDEWLPTFAQLSACLTTSYVKRAKAKKVRFSHGSGVPTMVVPGASPGSVTCYACGEKGHKKGDSICKAGPGDIWSGAPARWKEAYAKRKGKAAKAACRDFQKGYCKYGEKCRFSHEK